MSISKIVVIILALIAVVGVLAISNFVCGVAPDAANVAQKEFYPSALLKKYEWFKDASAQCDKKLADIKVYENKFKTLNEQYAGAPRTKWAREDREQYNLWQSELAGIAGSYNQIASEYNSNMAKFNYQFTNVGDLPPGQTTPLPREYKPYVTE